MYARCIYICSLIMMHMCMMHTSVIFNPWLCCMCVWCGWNFVTNQPTNKANSRSRIWYFDYHQRIGILLLKKRENRDKCSFATKQCMFGVFAIDEIIRYRGSPFPTSRILCHPVRGKSQKMTVKRADMSSEERWDGESGTPTETWARDRLLFQAAATTSTNTDGNKDANTDTNIDTNDALWRRRFSRESGRATGTWARDRDLSLRRRFWFVFWFCFPAFALNIFISLPPRRFSKARWTWARNCHLSFSGGADSELGRRTSCLKFRKIRMINMIRKIVGY